LDAINRIEEYLHEVTEADFYKRYLIQDGVKSIAVGSESFMREKLAGRVKGRLVYL
jgi:hypothetical protein